MEKSRIERAVPRPSEEKWGPPNILGRKVSGINMSVDVDQGSRLGSGARENYGTPELERSQQKSGKIINLEERTLGLRTLDNKRIAREVILAHEFSDEEKRETFFAAERYRLLATRILQVNRSLRSQIFLVTSAIA